MLRHVTSYRVIYGDTDMMGVAYHANYLRWFEIGRTEMFRHLNLPYRQIEAEGIFMPVAEAYVKYLSGARYDDLLQIETMLTQPPRGIMQFDYVIRPADGDQKLVTGFTRHAFVDHAGKVVRPPKLLTDLIRTEFDRAAFTSDGTPGIENV